MKTTIKAILVGLSLILSTSASHADNLEDIFNWDMYNKFLKNDEIQLSSKCEALDLSIYNKSVFEYEIIALANLIFKEELIEKHILEARMAFYVSRSYFSGKNDGIKLTSNKTSEAIFLKAQKELNCHDKYKK